MGSINNPFPPNLFLTRLFRNKPTINAHYTADITLAADVFANSVLINAGVTVSTNNFRIFCLHSLVNNGTIQNNGGTGTDGTGLAAGIGGTNGLPGTLPSCQDGVNGIYGLSAGLSSSTLSHAYSARGGAGGLAGAFAAGTAGSVIFENDCSFYTTCFETFLSPYVVLLNTVFPANISTAGGSGASNDANAGTGGSGASGKMVVIMAQSIVNNGSILAKGGNAGSPFAGAIAAIGGSGGGGGGLIYLAFNSLTPGTILVSGGLGSSGLNAGGNGSNGNQGLIYYSFLP